MFQTFPLEVTEKILLFLNVTDILSTLSAFDKHYSILHDYFWKRICIREGFTQAYISQNWYESFRIGVNKKEGLYNVLNVVPGGTLEHVYMRAFIAKINNVYSRKETTNEYSYFVFLLDEKSNFTVSQRIKGDNIQFKDEFIIIQERDKVIILKYNYVSDYFEYFTSLPELMDNLFGLSDKYCAAYNSNLKRFNIYNFEIITESQNIDIKNIPLPADIKFVMEKILHCGNIVISTLSYNDGYKIKVYDIENSSWTLDLICFGSTGITNDPNIWVGSNFIGCCDVSYRLRGIYFGPFKVWTKKGKMLFQTDIEPSTRHYLRCFFEENHVLLTTSDNTITVYNNFGEAASKFHTSSIFLDIKLSSGHLLFFLLEEKESVEVYDWSECRHLYNIRLEKLCCKALYSDFFYCPISNEDSKFLVVKFF